MVLGVVCTLFMITGSPVKGVLMVALGFLIAAIGIDVVNGRERFTFGSVNLSAGIELLAVVIGLFGVTEVLSNVETGRQKHRRHRPHPRPVADARGLARVVAADASRQRARISPRAWFPAAGR